MAKKINNLNYGPRSLRDEHRATSQLLFPRMNPRHTPDQLYRIARLLLLARTEAERHIVGFHLLHRQPLPAVATRLKMAGARVKEIFESLVAQDRLAAESPNRDKQIAAMKHST